MLMHHRLVLRLHHLIVVHFVKIRVNLGNSKLEKVSSSMKTCEELGKKERREKEKDTNERGGFKEKEIKWV